MINCGPERTNGEEHHPRTACIFSLYSKIHTVRVFNEDFLFFSKSIKKRESFKKNQVSGCQFLSAENNCEAAKEKTICEPELLTSVKDEREEPDKAEKGKSQLRTGMFS